MAERGIRNALVTITGAQSNKISEAKFGGSRRLVLEVSNLNAAGGNDVFVTIDKEAEASIGRRIQPGQTITWSADGGYIPPQGVVNAYSAGNTNLSIYEEVG